MPPDKEQTWMRRLKNGDDSALNDILDRYETPILNFAYKYVHDTTVAEDIAQDVFIQVYKRRHEYKPTGKFSTWLFTIAAHRCLNEKRSYKRRAELFDQSDPSQPTPDEESDKQRMARAVWESIENLPGNQRVAILLAKYEEMPLADIGRVLGATEGAVKQLLHRAKVELREKLAQFL